MDIGSFGLPFLMTMIAGLSTGIGGALAIMTKATNRNFLCASLGFSAGMMLYVSFMEMMPSAKEALMSMYEEKWAVGLLLLAFFGGIGLIAIIDFLIPEANNPHELSGIEGKNDKSRIGKMGIVMAISMAIHNFPEGIATFSSAMEGLGVAIPITIAIAIHNIPEGIAVGVPIYQATGSKRKAFWMSFSSGLAEPIGALIAYLFLMPFWSAAVNGVVLAAVSGIMVYISLDELLPTAEKLGHHHLSILGVIVGMLVMAGSLFLFI